MRHGAFRRIHQNDSAVDHIQNALDLAAEIGVTRRIDDIDARVPPGHGRTLGKDGNSPLPLQIVGIHCPFVNALIVPKCAALFQYGINQGRLAVIHMRDNSNIA